MRDFLRNKYRFMKNIGTIHERIKILVATLANGKNTVFAQELGVSEANIRGYMKNVVPKADILSKIVICYDKVNPRWLLTGTGPMLLPESENAPSQASAGADKESLTYRQDNGSTDATASGDHSVTAINSTVNAAPPASEAALRRENELLHSLIDEKERLLAEKERLISVLMERK